MTIGNAKVMRLEEARHMAGKVQHRLAMGQDPIEEQQAARGMPTFADFVSERYLPYVRGYKRSWGTDVSLLNNHLLPRFGKRLLDEITMQDIVKMHHERRASGAAAGSANRLLILMRYIFNCAIRWDVPGVRANPTKGVPLMEENNHRERYLSTDEARRLYDAVCASPNERLRHIVAMLILTGARKRELLDARWPDFDIERRLWRIPKTKAGKARYVPLSDGAVAVLKALPHEFHCDWAFANPKTGKPFVSIFCAWDTARRKAGLADVRIHDLRHSFASLLVNQGRTLYEVQQILGHTQVRTTQRYAHLSHQTLVDAANAATRSVGDVMVPTLRAASV